MLKKYLYTWTQKNTIEKNKQNKNILAGRWIGNFSKYFPETPCTFVHTSNSHDSTEYVSTTRNK